MVAQADTALVVGAGPGLGAALGRAFAGAGMAVALAARDGERAAALADAIRTGDAPVAGYRCDATDAQAVAQLFGRVEAEIGPPSLVVYNAGAFAPAAVVDIDPAVFEQCWRVLCLGGLLVGQQAARRMVARGAGSILFTGATAALRGAAGFANLAVGKFGLRALAQSMARELGPSGVHVAHVVIDGLIRSPRWAEVERERGPDATLDPDAIADACLWLHRQPRSAWTQELDLRPWVERF